MINRTQWLKDRKSSIGASDVASILRIPGAYGTPLDVYLDKITPEISDYDNKAMMVGRMVEGAIANLYEIETGRPVDDLGATLIVRHPDYPWLGATRDRVTAECHGDPMAPLELKHVSRFDCTPDDWEDVPPFAYQSQLNIQMFCTDALWGSLAGMFPGYQLAYKDMEISHDFLDMAVPRLEKFWKRVENREPPPVKQPGDLKALKQIWSKPTKKIISLPSVCTNYADCWIDAKTRMSIAENDKHFYEAKIREQMKEATTGALNDGTYLTLNTTKRKESKRVVEAGEFRTLRHKKGL